MYQGEVNVVQEQLASFLTTAELLAVQGLTDGTGKDSDSIVEVGTWINFSRQQIFVSMASAMFQVPINRLSSGRCGDSQRTGSTTSECVRQINDK